MELKYKRILLKLSGEALAGGCCSFRVDSNRARVQSHKAVSAWSRRCRNTPAACRKPAGPAPETAS